MSQSSRGLKGVYRVTSAIDGASYSVDMTPHGRRKMHGVFTGTDIPVDVLIGAKERPDGLRITVQSYVLYGDWLDAAHRTLEVTGSDTRCIFIGTWERLEADKESEWSVSLQWTREHRFNAGNRREALKATTEFATLLRDLAPEKTFDPRTLWDPKAEAEAAKAAAAAAAAALKDASKKKKGKKKNKKQQLSKAAQIIAANTKRMAADAEEKDLIQLQSAKKNGRAQVARVPEPCRLVVRARRDQIRPRAVWSDAAHAGAVRAAVGRRDRHARVTTVVVALLCR